MARLERRTAAEFVGTFWLVLGGCGSAVIGARFPEVGIGHLGVALAFGLSVLSLAYALAHVSGAHFNPAVSVGLWAARRFPAAELLPYVLAQVAGGIAAAGVLYLIASGQPGFSAHEGFAANGYGSASPGGFGLGSALLTEVLTTGLFVLVILGTTHKAAPAGFAPLAIGLCLTLIHLVSLPITNTSVNPARSTGPALFAGAVALQQLWLFWLAPLMGGMLGGVAYRALLPEEATHEPKVRGERPVRPAHT